jgi:hypothetical protein
MRAFAIRGDVGHLDSLHAATFLDKDCVHRVNLATGCNGCVHVLSGRPHTRSLVRIVPIGTRHSGGRSGGTPRPSGPVG